MRWVIYKQPHLHHRNVPLLTTTVVPWAHKQCRLLTLKQRVCEACHLCCFRYELSFKTTVRWLALLVFKVYVQSTNLLSIYANGSNEFTKIVSSHWVSQLIWTAYLMRSYMYWWQVTYVLHLGFTGKRAHLVQNWVLPCGGKLFCSCCHLWFLFWNVRSPQFWFAVRLTGWQ